MKDAEFMFQGSLPHSLLPEFLQYVRDFETRHKEVMDIAMGVNCPEMNDTEVVAMLDNLKPPFAHKQQTRLTKEETLEKPAPDDSNAPRGIHRKRLRARKAQLSEPRRRPPE